MGPFFIYNTSSSHNDHPLSERHELSRYALCVMRYVPMDPFDVGSLAGIIVILVLFCLTIFEMGRPIFEESNSKVYGDIA